MSGLAKRTLKMINHETLLQILTYNPRTGEFHWKQRGANLFNKSDKYPFQGTAKRWNKRYSGKRAGTVFSSGGDRLEEKISIFNRTYLSHRLAWLYVYGDFPKDEIDHIDGNPTNNSIKNLRSATSQENKKNMCRPKTNTSGVIGVGWRKCRKKWRATISLNNKQLHLGYFDSFEDACKSRKKAETKYNYHENHGRNPLAM